MSATITTSLESASPTPSTSPSDSLPISTPHGSPVVAFLIGLSIILISSILNAGGLNLTKLDHIRTSSLPKSARRPDYLRPLWVVGMLLYILSQLIGSTLALEYMRAEYVAPLGSTSLIFNFLFASLIGNPVSIWDIYGTVVVVLGVVGIVGFGSINSGLHGDMDLDRLKTIWTRWGWLGYFLTLSIAIVIVYIGTSQLDAILVARADLTALPTSRPSPNPARRDVTWWAATKERYEHALHWTKEKLDSWTAAKDDNYVAWMLGIGWSCVGGALAGACLVFAKATVKMASLSISGESTSSQFAHPASIITVILLAVTAVTQIIALNRGLKVYDSTLVVPMFYGVYTASGFLNSLIFNDEVDAYKTWVLVALGFSILVLIAGVVLLTHKKPEPKSAPAGSAAAAAAEDGHSLDNVGSKSRKRAGEDVGEDAATWSIGGDSEVDSDTEGPKGSSSSTRKGPPGGADDPARRSPVQSLRDTIRRASGASFPGVQPVQKHAGEEGKGLMRDREDDDDEGISPSSPTSRGDRFLPEPAGGKIRSRSPSSQPGSDEFGSWEDARGSG